VLRKLRFEIAVKRRSRFALFQRRNRINGRPILRHDEVEMRSCRQTRLSDKSYEFALLDRTAGTNIRANTRKVRVSGRQAARVFDLHESAVTAAPAR
jgi:hypothetical protein